jgi:hypothetical protein
MRSRPLLAPSCRGRFRQAEATLPRRTSNKGSGDLAKGAIRAAPLDQYSDRSARKIVVTLHATSRFAPYFVKLTADRPRIPLLDEVTFPPKPQDADPITAVRVMWIPATICRSDVMASSTFKRL